LPSCLPTKIFEVFLFFPMFSSFIGSF
jgi:hypothetical protein